MKTVYVAMGADFIHAGHVNIVQKARAFGRVVVGVLTDAAIAKYKRLPITTYEQRKLVFENLKGVDEVIPQEDCSYRETLLKLKPDIVLHGDDWKEGIGSQLRLEVIELLKQWGGVLVEVPHTKELSSSDFVAKMQKNGTTPQIRLRSLSRMVKSKEIVRVLEVHNGLTGLIAENTAIIQDGALREFDAMWESSLTDSASKGRPDASVIDPSSRLHTVDQILEVTTKPMIVDGDNGGFPEQFKILVRSLERLGVSAVIIEDKIGPKKNSLLGSEASQEQSSIQEFCHKILAGKQAQVTDDFMIIGRIESLILGRGMDDALERASAYIAAGADGIMIHSAKETPDEIFEFCGRYETFDVKVPLVAVPSTYPQITEEELAKAGVKIVIYANHMLRSAVPAMLKTARTILESRRAYEACKDYCMPIKEILTLIPES
jgi:phosphoenolpyruvate phosphomutase